MALRVVGYTSDIIGGQVVVQNSEEDTLASNDPHELLAFVGDNYTDTEREIPYSEMKVAFDLDVFLSPILKQLPMSTVRKLAGPSHQSNGLFYIPGKLFSCEVDNHKSYFYHLAQYYEDLEPPTDPMVIAGLGRDVVDAYRQMGLSPYKLTSPVSVYESEIMSHMQIPTILDLPRGSQYEEVIDFAEACIGRLWISAYQLGHWNIGEVHGYDVQSCFAYHASQLYNIKYARFAKSKFLCEGADWGFIRGKITINDDMAVSPILRNTNGQVLNPYGTWEDVITLDEWHFIDKWKIGHFEPIEGWYIKFDAPVRPLEIPLQRLFDLRNKGGLVKLLAKRIANGCCYGKFIESHDDGTVGRYYNPLWAAMVSTRGRLQVAEFIYEHNLQDSLVHVGVDGLLTTKHVRIPDKVGMGLWKENPRSAALVLSPGRVYTADKKPQGLNYDRIMEMLESKPRESYYTAKLMRRQTLAESVEAGDLAHLGELKETHSSVDLNLLRTSQDRIFPKFPKTGSDLLTMRYVSRPLAIDDKGRGT